MGVNRESVARRNEATREAILATVMDLLGSGDTQEVTFQAIAEAMGVSIRTIFRYLPNQAALQTALVPLISARLYHVQPPDDVHGLPDYVARLYDACESNSGLVRSLVSTSFGRGILLEERARRLGKVQKLIAAAAPDAERDRRHQAAATIRFVASGAAWEFYRHQAGLSLGGAIAAASTVVTAALSSVGIG